MKYRRSQREFTISRRGLVPLFGGFALCALTTAPALGQTVIDREAQIKAAYVYRFLNYVHWPASQFASPQSPVVLGGVGDDPVNHLLKKVAESKNAGQRPLEYREVRSSEDAQGCHIIFVSSSASAKLAEDLLHDSDAHILYVGESSKFISHGGVINFLIRENKVRFELSRTNAGQRGLEVSSKLARLAIIVD